MTIALVTPYFPDKSTIDSGIANHYLLLAKELAALGNAVIVMHVRPQYENEQDVFHLQNITEDITVLTYKVEVPKAVTVFFKDHWAIVDFSLKLRSMVLTTRVLNSIIKKYGIQIIETSSYFSLCYFSLFKKINVPVVVRVSTAFSQIMHDYYPFRSRLLDIIAKMEITFIKRSRYLLSHAHAHVRELEQLYQIDSDRFTIIPHGVEISALSSTPVSETQPVSILYVGRFEYRKGIDVLLQSIPNVLHRHPEVTFTLIGADMGNEYQKEFIRNNKKTILERVFFIGTVDDSTLKKAYETCSIFVAPSRYESFGLIFIEAMSYGKPVVGCNVGGIPEIITDGFNGLFAVPGDAMSVADKLSHLITNPAVRAETGRNALKTVIDRFTGKQLALNSLTYYREVASHIN